jgi:microcystin-dependent protein
MSDQFLAEVRIFGCNFPPTGGRFATGSLTDFSEHSVFPCWEPSMAAMEDDLALPNLQGNVPLDLDRARLSLTILGTWGRTASHF